MRALTSFRAFRTTEMDELAVGREFADFESLWTAITNFLQKYLIFFFLNDSRAIEADVRRNTRKMYNVPIKICEDWLCVCSRSEKISIRPHQGSYFCFPISEFSKDIMIK